jgi:hypothetical protein
VDWSSSSETWTRSLETGQLVLLRHCSRLTWLIAGRYRAPRFSHAGLLTWRSGGRWADFPAAMRPHPRVGVAVDQRKLVPDLHPPGHDIQPWLRPVRWNPAPCRQHTPWRCPASRREDIAWLGGDPSAMPRRTPGHAVPASRGKRPFAAPTQAWSSHPCIIDWAVGSVEGSWPWWLSEGVEADDRAGQHGQRVEAFRAALVADAQPPEAAKPGPVRSILQRWRPSRAEDSIPRRAIRERMPRRRRYARQRR